MTHTHMHVQCTCTYMSMQHAFHILSLSLSLSLSPMQLFDLVRSERPAALEKVVPISGDCGEPGLGIGESDLQLLSENVSIIFHLAATIKFDEPLR